jgi:hypothetical protein
VQSSDEEEKGHIYHKETKMEMPQVQSGHDAGTLGFEAATAEEAMDGRRFREPGGCTPRRVNVGSEAPARNSTGFV